MTYPTSRTSLGYTAFSSQVKLQPTNDGDVAIAVGRAGGVTTQKSVARPCPRRAAAPTSRCQAGSERDPNASPRLAPLGLTLFLTFCLPALKSRLGRSVVCTGLGYGCWLTQPRRPSCSPSPVGVQKRGARPGKPTTETPFASLPVCSVAQRWVRRRKQESSG